MSWLLVAGDLTPLGGMDAANHALARYLAARAQQVHVVTHRAWDDLGGPHVTIACVARPLGSHALGAPLLDRSGRRAWARLIANHRPDHRPRAVVNGGNCAIGGAVNWVHYVHAAYRPQVGGSMVRRVKQALVHNRDVEAERAAFAAASLIVCNSERTRDDVLKAVDVDAGRVVVVPYGCDATRLMPVLPSARASARVALGWPAERPVAAFVGALGDRRKGFDTLFAAWMRLCADPTWDADLVVVGAGGEQVDWVRRARAGAAGDRVRFLGFRDDVPELLAAVDVLVHPARYEAYGLSVREALCRGIPAIVSGSAGVAAEYTGASTELLLTSAESPDELGARLRRWRAARECFDAAAATLGARLRARTWDDMAADIVAVVDAAEGARL